MAMAVAHVNSRSHMNIKGCNILLEIMGNFEILVSPLMVDLNI